MTVAYGKKQAVVRGVALIAVLICITSCAAIKDRWDRPQNNDTGNSSGQPDSNKQLPSLPQNVHLAFGNPSNATADASNENNYLLVGEGSAFSYNNSRGTINWISWKTTRADLGKSIERPDFRPDLRLPANFRRVGYYDYSGSGYDRGHMVPSADRFADARLNEETFMMSNIVPQTGALNQFVWEGLESYVRSQARRGFDAHQIAGVYGERGVLKNKVVVPTNCWKIIAFVPRGRSIDERTRIIAVDMPNTDGLENEPWENYKTSIRVIEERTGLNFFSTMPQGSQDQIETRIEIRSR